MTEEVLGIVLLLTHPPLLPIHLVPLALILPLLNPLLLKSGVILIMREKVEFTAEMA